MQRPAKNSPPPGKSEQPPQSIQRRYPVGFGHGRVVEGGVDEILDGIGLTLLVHDGLADMYDLRRLVTEAVNTQHLQRLAVEQDLQHPDRFATDLCPRGVLEERLANLVGNLVGGQLPLGLAQRTDLRNGVDTSGDVVHETPAVVLDDITGHRTPLVKRRTGQARPADHIASRIDIGDLGAIMLVHRQLTPTIGFQPDVLQAQAVGVAGTPVAPQQRIGLDLLAGLEIQHYAAVLEPLDLLVLFVVADQRHVVAQVIAQRVGNLVIQETQQPITVVNQVDLDSQSTEDRRILATDHPGAIDDQRARRVVELENGIAVIDARMVEVDIRGAIRPRAGGDDEFPGDQPIHRDLAVDQFHGVAVGKAPLAVEQVDTVARVIAVTRAYLPTDHLLGPVEHVGEGEVHRFGHGAEDRVGVELNDLLDRIAQRLGRDGAQVHAITAHHVAV